MPLALGEDARGDDGIGIGLLDIVFDEVNEEASVIAASQRQQEGGTEGDIGFRFGFCVRQAEQVAVVRQGAISAAFALSDCAKLSPQRDMSSARRWSTRRASSVLMAAAFVVLPSPPRLPAPGRGYLCC